MEKLNAEAENTVKRIREYTVREGLNMGDDLGDSGTLPSTVGDILRRMLQKFGKQRPGFARLCCCGCCCSCYSQLAS